MEVYKRDIAGVLAIVALGVGIIVAFDDSKEYREPPGKGPMAIEMEGLSIQDRMEYKNNAWMDVTLERRDGKEHFSYEGLDFYILERDSKRGAVYIRMDVYDGNEKLRVNNPLWIMNPPIKNHDGTYFKQQVTDDIVLDSKIYVEDPSGTMKSVLYEHVKNVNNL